MADKTVLAALLSFGAYILCFGFPLIVSVVIYRLFPETPSSAEGPLGGLKIKVGGAFAAYVITVVLSGVYGLDWMKTRVDDIGKSNSSVWMIEARLNIQDSSHHPITMVTNQTNTHVKIDPSPTRIAGSAIVVPDVPFDENHPCLLEFGVDGFDSYVKQLSFSDSDIVVDKFNKKMTIRNIPIVQSKDPTSYTGNTKSGSTVQPRVGSGPAPTSQN